MSAHIGRQKLDLCGTNSLARILRRFVGLVVARRRGAVFAAVLIDDKRSCRGLRFLRNALRVGPHVGDKTLSAAQLRAEVYSLVKLLRRFHRARRLEAELARRFLLERGCDKGRRGSFDLRSALYAFYGKGRTLHRIGHAPCVLLAVKLDLALGISPESHREADLTVGYGSADSPVFDRHKGAYLLLALNDYSRCNRLNASRRQPVLHLFPEQRTELIAHYAVKQTARLLRVHYIHVDGTRIFYSFLDGVLGDGVECHTQCVLDRYTERRGKMP